MKSKLCPRKLTLLLHIFSERLMTLIKKIHILLTFVYTVEVNEKEKLLLQQKLTIFVAQLAFEDALWSLLCSTGGLLCEAAPGIIWKCLW